MYPSRFLLSFIGNIRGRLLDFADMAGTDLLAQWQVWLRTQIVRHVKSVRSHFATYLGTENYLILGIAKQLLFLLHEVFIQKLYQSKIITFMNSHLFVHDIVVQGFSGLGVAQKLRGRDMWWVGGQLIFVNVQVKKGQNYVHVVIEWPLIQFLVRPCNLALLRQSSLLTLVTLGT